MLMPVALESIPLLSAGNKGWFVYGSLINRFCLLFGKVKPLKTQYNRLQKGEFCQTM
jgi:hypothetical protein